MRSRRSFSKEFKKEIVETVVSGSASAAELSREYHISPILISKISLFKLAKDQGIKNL